MMSATVSLLRMIYHVDFVLYSIWLHTLLVKENIQYVLLYHIIITCYVFWKKFQVS